MSLDMISMIKVKYMPGKNLQSLSSDAVEEEYKDVYVRYSNLRYEGFGINVAQAAEKILTAFEALQDNDYPWFVICPEVVELSFINVTDADYYEYRDSVQTYPSTPHIDINDFNTYLSKEFEKVDKR